MLPTNRKSLIFNHIPKSGGTSLGRSLGIHYGLNHILMHNLDQAPFLASSQYEEGLKFNNGIFKRFKREVLNAFANTDVGEEALRRRYRMMDSKQNTPFHGDLSQIEVIMGHFAEGVESYYRQIFPHAVTLVIVRSPEAQVQSLFRWLRLGRPSGIAPEGWYPEMTFKDFLRLESLREYQRRWLLDGRLDNYDFVLTTEGLENSYPHLLKSLNIPYIELPRVNTTPKIGLDYSQEEMELFLTSAKDNDLYADAVERERRLIENMEPKKEFLGMREGEIF